jgi:hypothetical protein
MRQHLASGPYILAKFVISLNASGMVPTSCALPDRPLRVF